MGEGSAWTMLSLSTQRPKQSEAEDLGCAVVRGPGSPPRLHGRSKTHELTTTAQAKMTQMRDQYKNRTLQRYRAGGRNEMMHLMANHSAWRRFMAGSPRLTPEEP
jgi:hypothetical protein